MAQYAFRLAWIEESAEIARLVNSAYRGESSRAGWTTEADFLGGQRTDPDAVGKMLSSPGNVILLAHDHEGKLGGCVLLEQQPDRAAYLGLLTVGPTIQAQGLGKVLVRRAEDYARREWGAAVMEMTVITCRHELIAWYERRGYCRTGEKRPFPMEDRRFGEPKVSGLEFEVLRKRLD